MEAKSFSCPDAHDMLWVEVEFGSSFEYVGVVRLVVEDTREDSVVCASDYQPHVLG